MRHDHKSSLAAARPLHAGKDPEQRGRPATGGAQVPLAVDEWELADQTWRDWRAAITVNFDPQAKVLTERAWAAGLLDGASTIVRPAANGEAQPSVRMMLEITEAHGDQGRINLMRFQRAVGGAGSIHGPYPNGVPGSYCYVWRGTSKEDLDKVWKATGPFLGLAKFVEFRRGLLAPASQRARRPAIAAAASSKKKKLEAHGARVRAKAKAKS